MPNADCLARLGTSPILSLMRTLIKAISTALTIVLTITLVLSLTCIGASPSLAQPTAQRAESSASYVPKQADLKDQQNIDFLYSLYETYKSDALLSKLQTEDIPDEALASRSAFSEFYYSPAKGAFNLRESMKLIRLMSCKASRISGVRGLDLVGIFTANDQQGGFTQELDRETQTILWKTAYEKFCPQLW